MLGPTERGIVVVASLFATLIMGLSDLGLRPALLYNLSRADGVDQAIREGIAVCTRFLPVAIAIAATLCASVYALGRGTILTGVSPGLALISFAFCVAGLLHDIMLVILNSLKDFWGFNFLNILPPILTLAALGCWWWWSGAKLNAMTMIGIYVFSMSVAALAGIPYVASKYRPSIDISMPPGWKRNYVWYGVKSSMAQNAVSLNLRLDSLLTNAFLGSRDVGFYSAGVSVAEIVQLIPTAVSVVLYPELGSLKSVERVRATLGALGATLFLMLGGGVLLAVLLPWGLPLLFGRDFAPAVPAALWLMPGMVGLTMLRMIGTATSVQGRPEYRTYAAVIGLLASVVLDFLLIPRFGIVGASWTSSITYWISALVIAALYLPMAGISWGGFLAGMVLQPVGGLKVRLLSPPASH